MCHISNSRYSLLKYEMIFTFKTEILPLVCFSAIPLPHCETVCELSGHRPVLLSVCISLWFSEFFATTYSFIHYKYTLKWPRICQWPNYFFRLRINDNSRGFSSTLWYFEPWKSDTILSSAHAISGKIALQIIDCTWVQDSFACAAGITTRFSLNCYASHVIPRLTYSLIKLFKAAGSLDTRHVHSIRYWLVQDSSSLVRNSCCVSTIWW